MIQSMTGFASKTISLTAADTREKAHVTISIKALNSRFFDTTCKLHYMLSSLENTLIGKAKKKLHRGHIYITMHVSNPSALRSTIQPALATIASYVDALNSIRTLCKLEEPITLTHILQLPNIFSSEESELNEQTVSLIYTAIDELLELVVRERVQEGTALKQDLEKRLAIMLQEITIIEQISYEVIARQKAKVLATLKEIEADESLLSQAQKNALYTMLDKLDLHEEIVRFNNHLVNLKGQLESADVEQGKRIDFTLQELAREINTISAKCSDATISKHAINVKVEIEKAREQTQNIV